MAKADMNNFLLPWTQSGQEAERLMTKQFEDGIDYIDDIKFDFASRIKKGKDRPSHLVRWAEEHTYQTHVLGTLTGTTLVFSGYLLGDAITSAGLKQCVKVGTIVERVSDNLQLLLSLTEVDIDYDNLTAANCSVWGNSGTLSNDTDAQTYRLVGDVVSPYDEAFMPRSLTRKTRWCSAQIFKDNFEMPLTAESIEREFTGMDEIGHQVTKLQEFMRERRALAIMYGRPPYSDGKFIDAYQTERSSVIGVYTWADICQSERANPNIAPDQGGNAVDSVVLNQMITAGWEEENYDYNKGDWCILVSPNTFLYMNDWGQEQIITTQDETVVGRSINKFKSSVGKTFDIVVDPIARKDTLAIVDSSAFEWGYVSKQHPQVRNLGEDNTLVEKKKLWFMIWGTKVRDPRHKIMTMTGLPTSYA